VKHRIVNGSCLTDATCSTMASVADMRLFATVYPSLLLRYMAQMEMVFNARTGHPVKVLDVGCGNGAAIRLWASQNFSTIARKCGISYTGVDLFGPALKNARKNAPQVGKAYIHKVDFIDADISEDWDWAPENWFDVIWYTEVIEHVPVGCAQRTLENCARVIRPGGSMLLATPAPRDGKLVWPQAHLHEFTEAEVRGMLKRTGWTIEDVWGCGVNWSKLRPVLRKELSEDFQLYELLRGRIGGPFARAVMQALLPDFCTDLCYRCRYE